MQEGSISSSEIVACEHDAACKSAVNEKNSHDDTNWGFEVKALTWSANQFQQVESLDVVYENVYPEMEMVAQAVHQVDQEDYNSFALIRPKGILLYAKVPHFVVKAVFNLSFSSTIT